MHEYDVVNWLTFQIDRLALFAETLDTIKTGKRSPPISLLSSLCLCVSVVKASFLNLKI